MTKFFLVEEYDAESEEKRKVQLIMTDLSPYFFREMFRKNVETLADLQKELRLLKEAKEHEVRREEDESLESAALMAIEEDKKEQDTVHRPGNVWDRDRNNRRDEKGRFQKREGFQERGMPNQDQNTEKQDRKRRPRLCFYGKLPGHFKRDCEQFYRRRNKPKTGSTGLITKSLET